MPIPELTATWSFTSSGVGVWVPAAYTREVTCYLETAAGSTASWQIQTAASTGGITMVLSSGTLDASSAVSTHYAGPLGYLRPRVKTITSTGTVTITAFGN